MSARSDLIVLPGRQLFSSLITPVIPPGGREKRYYVKLQVSKDTPEWEQLWYTIEAVADKTWANAADEHLGKFHQAITSGMEPKYSPISIQDGELFDPQYNAGFWMLQATRREKAGPPQLRGLDGEPIGSEGDAPQDGDGVLLMINVWAQPQYDRMNFSLEAVRRVVVGERVGGPSRDVIEAGVAALEQMAVPRTIPGVKPVGAIAATASRSAAPAAPQRHTPRAEPPLTPPSRVREARTVLVDEPQAETTAVPVAARRRGLVKID